MTSSFVRLVYKKAKSLHEQRGSFQARVEGDGPRCPAAIFVECVNDLKHAIRICRIAQSFVDVVSAGAQETREASRRHTENSECVDTDLLPDSAWSDLLNCLNTPKTPCPSKLSPGWRSKAVEPITSS